ncbi:MAG: FAD binding domain-containing protein, partial [bacterium]
MSEALEYVIPGSAADAVDLLRRWNGDATVLAGGQDVVPLMNQSRIVPRRIIDLQRLDEFRRIRADGTLSIGALATHREVERSPAIRAAAPLLAEAAGQIGGGPQVRNRGTIGGAVCAGNPVYDYPACLVALDADLLLIGPHGERAVPAVEFFQGPGRTAKQPEELLAAVRIPPLPPGAGAAYRKLKFTDGCYCIASAAAIVAVDPDRTVRAVRVAVGGVAPVPVRLPAVEQALRDRPLTAA